MSHFSTILENLRMVAIKRSPLAQQKQKQQQQVVTPTSPQQQEQQQQPPQVTTSLEIAATKSKNYKEQTIEQEVNINNDNKQIKVFICKQPPTPQSPEPPPTPQPPTAMTVAQHTKSSHNLCNENHTEISSSGNAVGNSHITTPDKKYPGHKRQSISARGSIGSAEYSLNKNSPGRERNRSGSNVIIEVDSGGSPGGGKRGPRELSPTPKSQQRRMSTDFRSRAGSFIHVDEEGRSILMRKPVRLKNIEGRPEVYDTLHSKGREVLSCSKSTCMSSIMHFGIAPVEARKTDVVLEHAKDFLDQYFTSIKRLSCAAHEARWKQVRQSIETTGHYQLTETELIYGAKLAWRNSSRCIGRIQWSKLQTKHGTITRYKRFYNNHNNKTHCTTICQTFVYKLHSVRFVVNKFLTYGSA